MTEIERKFMVRELPDGWRERPSALIRQAYLTGRDDSTEVRLRDKDGQLSLTVKRGSGSVRDEVDVPLSRGDFDRLWELTSEARLEKRRSVIPLGEGPDAPVAEIDVYGGALAPLTVVEVEFDSENSRDAFEPPAWFGQELTGDARFSNRRLAYDGPPPREATVP